ncbi:hypothetical protein JTB14_007326 [Gonioctena quinquepunctata]|nr:hypothetical protein JTB14_007326 [Gonioctena quinquepunctata]
MPKNESGRLIELNQIVVVVVTKWRIKGNLCIEEMKSTILQRKSQGRKKKRGKRKQRQMKNVIQNTEATEEISEGERNLSKNEPKKKIEGGNNEEIGKGSARAEVPCDLGSIVVRENTNIMKDSQGKGAGSSKDAVPPLGQWLKPTVLEI